MGLLIIPSAIPLEKLGMSHISCWTQGVGRQNFLTLKPSLKAPGGGQSNIQMTMGVDVLKAMVMSAGR